MLKYGVFIGRFQPLHLGHMAVISEIIADGLKPLVLVGCSKDMGNSDKNPYSHVQIFDMFKTVYKGTEIFQNFICDNPDNKDWVDEVLENVSNDHGIGATLYYHRKEVDCKPEWGGGHYVDLLKGKMEIKQSKYAKKLNFPICATDIRAYLESNKHYLDGRVYSLLKKW